MRAVSRRAAAGGLLAAAAAPAVGEPTAREMRVQGLTSYSESAMVMSVSADGRSALTLRFCRFPEVGTTWLWGHVVRDGAIYAFAQHDLPCGPQRLADGQDADYRQTAPHARLARTGKGPGLKHVRLEAALPFHEGTDAPLGPGGSPGRFTGDFTPTHALSAAAVLKDRDEVYGTFAADIAVGGRRWRHEGVAKFHEQRQTAPRFTHPFCYSWLGAPQVATTTLLLMAGASGGWIFGDAQDGLADMTADPPGDVRRVAYRLKSGRRMPGQLSAVVRYHVPIFGRPWRGSFVRGIVDGIPVVGVMNDWVHGGDVYGAAAARNR